MMKKVLWVFVLVMMVGCSGKGGKDLEMKEERLGTILEYINYDWWSLFGDKDLEIYILKGAINNNDLKALDLKVEEYSKYVKYTFGQELPTVSAGLSYSNMRDVPVMNNKINQDGLMLPLTMSYEVDLFGKNRKKTKSTKLQLESYRYQLQSSYISYVSSLATIYFNIVKYNEIIEQYQELIKIEGQILDNAKEEVKNELLSVDDLNAMKQNIKKLENERINIHKIRDSLLTEFAVMLGEDPNKSHFLKVSNLDKIKMINVEYGFNLPISSNIIFKRPDVLAYEKEMKKAKIDIEIARREFLPTINISGSLIFNNIGSGGFFSASNTIKSLMASASQSLFAGGRKKANLDMMNLKYEQIFENYKKITLQAIKEVNDSLANIFYDLAINNNNKENYFMELKNYENDNIKYKDGLSSETDLLRRKEQLIVLKMDFINSKIQSYIDYVSLYKSTAGNI